MDYNEATRPRQLPYPGGSPTPTLPAQHHATSTVHVIEEHWAGHGQAGFDLADRGPGGLGDSQHRYW
jgi:hypothetical protein